MPKLEIRPITLRAACAFILEHHRHNKPPRGHKFSVAVHSGDLLVGVATAGRPVARAFDNGFTLEVNRTCTDGTLHANSMLYGAVWRAAKAMGYRRCVTYTQADESGASLRAAGWRKVRDIEPREGWAASTGDERLKAMRDSVGNGGVARQLWEITAAPAASTDGLISPANMPVNQSAAARPAGTSIGPKPTRRRR